MNGTAPSQQPPPDSHAFRRWLRWGGTLLAGALFVFILFSQDWRTVLALIGGLPFWLLGVAFGLLLAGQVANAWRWLTLLRVQHPALTLGLTVRLVFAGAFTSNFLPSTIGGDALRVIAIRRHLADPVLALASVVIDRALNLVAMLALLPFAWFAFIPIPPVAASVGAGGMLPPLSAFRRRVSALLRQTISKLAAGLRFWSRQPRTLLGALAISWASVLVTFLAVWLLARGLGIPVGLHQVIGVSTTVYLLTALPIAINGYGVREVAIVGLYTQLGATPEQAAALALITRLLALLATLPGAFWFSSAVAGAPAAPGE